MPERCIGYSKNRGDVEKTTVFPNVGTGIHLPQRRRRTSGQYETDDGKPDEKAETHQSGGVYDVFQVNDHWRENKRRRNDFYAF